MARATIANERDAQDVGAAIVSAWFKVLPDFDVDVASISVSGSVLTVTTKADHRLSPGQLVYFSDVGGLSNLNGRTVAVTTPSGSTFDASLAGVTGTHTPGTGHVVGSLDGVRDELNAVLRRLI